MMNILLTGSTGGLGRAVLPALAAHADWQLWLPVRSVQKAESIFHQPGSNMHIIPLKEMTESGIDELYERISGQATGLDALVHLVGGFRMDGDLSETSPSAMEEMLQVNFWSAFLFLKKAFEAMKNRGGKMIFIGAKAAVDYSAGMGGYIISKAALVAMARVMANEGKPYGISVHVIFPSIIDTEANRKAMPDADHSRWITPHSIARKIEGILQTDSRGLNLEEIHMYGQL